MLDGLETPLNGQMDMKNMDVKDNQDPRLPQWVRSRLKFTLKKPACGPTHGACRCFIERIIHLEAEVSELRQKIDKAS